MPLPLRRSRTTFKPVHVVTNHVEKTWTWAEIEAEDYFIYAKNLRALGCPEQTVDDILRADVEDNFAGRRQQIVTEPVNRFWEFVGNEEAMEELIKGKATELSELYEAKAELLVKLLGTKKRRPGFLLSYDDFGGRLGFLPEEKRAEVLRLHNRFEPRWQQTREKAATNVLSLETSLRQVNDAFVKELARVLTPVELEEYQLSVSPAARPLRQRLEGFEPTESEFRHLYALQMELEEKQGKYTYSPDTFSGSTAASIEQDVDQLFSAGLSVERKKEWDRARTQEFRRFYAFTQRLGLPRSAALQLDNIATKMNRMLEDVKKDTTIFDSERTEQINRVEAVRREMVHAVIGEDNVPAYERNVF